MNQWDPNPPTGPSSPFIPPAVNLPIWQLIKQAYALIWQERSNIPQVLGLIMLAEFLCYQFGHWLNNPIVTLILSLFAMAFLHVIFQVRWFRFVLLGKIPHNMFGEWRAREWEMVRYGMAIGLIVIGFGSLIGLPIFFAVLFLFFGALTTAVKFLIAFAAFAVVTAIGLYLGSLYTLIYPHVAIRQPDSERPLMKWARKTMQPQIWHYIFAHGFGIALLVIPFMILLSIAVFLGVVALPFAGASPASVAAQWTTSGAIAILEIAIALVMYVIIWLFQANLMALAYYHLVTANGSTVDGEPATALTPIQRLVTKSQRMDSLVN